MELPRYHRLRSTFYRLEATRCEACQAIHFPPRNHCLECGAHKVAPVRLSGRGRVLSLTRVFQPARGFNDAAGALVALIELKEGIRVTAQLTDVEAEEVAVGLNTRNTPEPHRKKTCRPVTRERKGRPRTVV